MAAKSTNSSTATASAAATAAEATGTTTAADTASAAATAAAVQPVRLLSGASAQDVPAGSLIIVCRDPGFRRAGMAHPQVAVYPVGRFTAAQLTAMEDEPMLELIEVPA
jgi:Mu-like prophage FluMu N-terminal domain